MSRAQPSGVAALLEDYRKFAGGRLWLALALMLLGALAEGFGLLMIVPLASIAMGSGARPLGALAGLATGMSAGERLGVALVLFVAAMTARAALLYARDLVIARLSTGYEASLRLRSAATLARRGWTFASRIGQAGMQSLLLNDVPRSVAAIAFMEQLAIGVVMVIVQLAIAAVLSPVLTGVALVILVAGLLLTAGWTRRGVRSGLALVERFEESTASGFQMHAGLKAALAQGTTAQFLDEYRSSLASARMENIRFAGDLARARSIGFLGSAVAAAVLLFVGVQLLKLPLPILIASLALFARMSGPAQSIQQALQNIAAYAPAFAAVERRIGKLSDAAVPARAAKPVEWGELRLEKVSYEHSPGLGIVDATLRLVRGEWLGLTGPSGAGKTTLVDLVAGLLSPARGSIVVDGQPLEGEWLDRWRVGLAYVGQEGSVFDDSVRGNLLAEGSAADDAELWHVLDLIGLAERVRAFPAGLDERVGDRGSALSGGERQRLAIARALLRRPSLLLLDEATAALDAQAEAGLLQRVRALEPRPAAIVVAHRDSTLNHCDSLLSIQHCTLRKSDDLNRLEG
jgi:ATP-binding cassette subfamily C protein